MLTTLNLKDCTVAKLKFKVINLRRNYASTIEWRSQTGQGVLGSEGVESFEGVFNLEL